MSHHGGRSVNGVCVLGSLNSPELRLASDWLTQAECDFFPTLEELLGAEANVTPRLIVIVQTTRGQFHESIVSKLNHRFPDTRILLLVGSWSEGETRSGTPLPDVERVYASEFVTRMDRYSLPEKQAIEPSTANAIIISHDNCFAESVVESIIVAGGNAVAVRANSHVCAPNANVVIYDAHPNLDRRSTELTQWRQKCKLPIAVMVDFPRGFEVDQLLALGAATVLPKPFSLDDLLFRVREFTTLPEWSRILCGSQRAKHGSAA